MERRCPKCGLRPEEIGAGLGAVVVKTVDREAARAPEGQLVALALGALLAPTVRTCPRCGCAFEPESEAPAVDYAERGRARAAEFRARGRELVEAARRRQQARPL